MSDFVSSFWSFYVAVGTLGGIAFCVILLVTQNKRRSAAAAIKAPELHGHVWDEDLAEYNNPLPRWWMWLFYITIIFGLAYIALYPGLGSFAGVLGWTSEGEYGAEQKEAADKYGPLFDKYAKQDLLTIAADKQAHDMGQRLFLNYCSQCHGSDAQGAKGFPNLTDQDWLYGGNPQDIRTSIAEGRNGVMPPWAQALSADNVKNVTYYVLSLSGLPATPVQINDGKKVFAGTCAACHGPDAKGNTAIGAPNLTDKVWLHGGSIAAVTETITKGRMSHMPAHKELLDDAKINLLAAYVYSLSHDASQTAQK